MNGKLSASTLLVIAGLSVLAVCATLLWTPFRVQAIARKIREAPTDVTDNERKYMARHASHSLTYLRQIAIETQVRPNPTADGASSSYGEAVDTLGLMQLPEAENILSELMNSDEPMARSYAASTVFENARLHPGLMPKATAVMLNDPDSNARWSAVYGFLSKDVERFASREVLWGILDDTNVSVLAHAESFHEKFTPTSQKDWDRLAHAASFRVPAIPGDTPASEWFLWLGKYSDCTQHAAATSSVSSALDWLHEHKGLMVWDPATGRAICTAHNARGAQALPP